jgi:hypothetical protein
MFAWLPNLIKKRRLARWRRWLEVDGQALFCGVSAFQTDPKLAEAFAERGVETL